MTLLAAVFWLLSLFAPQPAAPVARAVLFWAEGCPSCTRVMQQTLPTLQTRYGAQIDVYPVEISGETAYRFFQDVGDGYALPREMRAIPALVIGSQLLVGADQIASRLPRLIADTLAAGGSDFPNLAGMRAYLSATGEATLCSASRPCAGDVLAALSYVPLAAQAQTGNNGFGLAIAIMVGMALVLLYVLVATARMAQGGLPYVPSEAAFRLIPVVAVLGMGVAGYLTYVETQNVAAVCGPVGDCNAVQASPYATLFGFLPVGVVGMLGYVGVLAAWALAQWGGGRLAELAPVLMFGMALFGVLFSLYLTYLEPFVIGAVCAWCLASAVLITLVLFLHWARPSKQ